MLMFKQLKLTNILWPEKDDPFDSGTMVPAMSQLKALLRRMMVLSKCKESPLISYRIQFKYRAINEKKYLEFSGICHTLQINYVRTRFLVLLVSDVLFDFSHILVQIYVIIVRHPHEICLLFNACTLQTLGGLQYMLQNLGLQFVSFGSERLNYKKKWLHWITNIFQEEI